MKSKSVLITGANKSIGFETARQMGRLGYRIWLGCRDEARGQSAVASLAAQGVDVRLLIIDVTDMATIQAAAQRVLKEEGTLDILINNAGISGNYPVAPSEQSIRDIETIYDTNVLGAIRVTQAFLPLLKAAAGASVVMVSSGLGSLTWVSDPNHPFSRVEAMGYNSSKTALNAVTVAFAKELRDFNISVNAVDPGYTATDFNGHTGYRTVEQAAEGIVWLAGLDPLTTTAGFYFDKSRAPW
ncbi:MULTISPECIES: SDR family oxidoreductase [Pantoea]|jgi:NAD(P)-dependent dehydrogenase (short-subunit alcohol dehydrogenase family)|uniref:SDR family oxidoreductase n=1 Tax=Pantoea TaxID=53335 RepID=UPI000EA06E22|nr:MULTISPECIES: SDR family oxidoreductase [Pantoea]MBZ6384314.1 SDR family oxidoreductase [Pantoea piersonii]MBZ6398576.1 SDR family oxidoreductase [Pantoea piersonii]MBZ6406425.1 SDR family oxidoreductase [Pantoea piersonii]MBZ6425171.1 SDR family oxidoreductase [Pantoea piersonii]NYB02658.1 SDR family oxidoreductase [Pantoea piersonii]